jgi:cell fate (sporulation/competence/biofilm development) regulator YmcA (YheA/YmcA/DUF963 family)
MLQRELNIPYHRAQELMNELENQGVVGEFRANQMRQVFSPAKQIEKDSKNGQITENSTVKRFVEFERLVSDYRKAEKSGKDREDLAANIDEYLGDFYEDEIF